jgi:hypothetical protein
MTYSNKPTKNKIIVFNFLCNSQYFFTFYETKASAADESKLKIWNLKFSFQSNYKRASISTTKKWETKAKQNKIKQKTLWKCSLTKIAPKSIFKWKWTNFAGQEILIAADAIQIILW